MADESGFRIATLRLDPAALDQDRLDGLRDAVAANPLRAVARHEADDEAADHRHQNLQPAKMVARGRNHAVPQRW